MNHPADVHQFRFLYTELSKTDKITIVARDKECTQDLLTAFKIPFIARRGYTRNLFEKALGLFLIEYKLLNIARKNKIDLFVASSGNVYMTHVAFLLRKPCLIFDDTEHAKIQKWISFPFATKIIVPDCYTIKFPKFIKKKVIYYKGYKELAYLHKKYFKPKKMNLKGENILLRFVSWDASHDVGVHSGINQEELFTQLQNMGTVHISAEGKLPTKLEKYRIKIKPEEFHSLLYNMDLVVSEGGSVAAESAVLGVPTVYINDLKMGYTDELAKEGLLFQTTNNKDIIKKSKLIIGKRTSLVKLLSKKEDVNAFMVALIKKWKK